MKGTGYVTGIYYSPVEPNLVYAQTDMGGTYRWDDAIARWTPLNDWSKLNDWSVQQLGVDAMAVDPVEAGKVYMVCGTYNSPAAIFRSTNKGATWSRWNVPSGQTLRANGNGGGRTVGPRMAIDPNLPSKILFGSRMDGLWQSTNSAAAWSKLGAFPATGDTSGAANQVGIAFVVFDKSSGTVGSASQRIYVGVCTSAGTKIYRSSDAGATWDAMPGQPTSATAFPLRAALTPDGSSLYVTYSDNPGPNGPTTGGVYRVSAPGSEAPTWTALQLPVLSPGGWSGVAIDPSNANRIMVSTLARWGAKDDLYRSLDGGTTWKAVNIRAALDNSPAPYANSVGPHWINDVAIDPFDPNELLFTTGNGLYRTSNLTAVDTSGGVAAFRFFNDGIEQAAVAEVVSPPTGPVRLFSAIGDRDGFRHLDFNVSPATGCLGQTQNIRMGSSSDIAVAWNDANFLVRAGSSTQAQYSTDNGITWTRFAAVTGASSGEIEISPDGTRAVWDPAGAAPQYATRTGATWSAWTPITFSGSTPAADLKLAADLSQSGTFYAYQGASVWKSTNGGASFALVTATAPASGSVLRSVFGQPGHLVMATGYSNTGVWRSTDGGQTWTRLATAAVTQAVEAGVGAAPPGKNYPCLFVAGIVSGKTGFFRSDDQGATWIEISDAARQFGLPKVIQGDPLHYGRAYIGTDGLGVRIVDFADRNAPTCTSIAYDVNANALRVGFSEDVSGTLDVSDVTITRAGNGATGVPTAVTFNATTNVATFTLPASMNAGDYAVALNTAGISDAAGNALAATGAAGSFFVLPGDANRDRVVNFDDLLILASNYNRLSGQTFTSGDFTRDGAVNFDDLLILAANYNGGVPAAAAAPLLLTPPDSSSDDGGTIADVLQ
jgi:hypothetical protein